MIKLQLELLIMLLAGYLITKKEIVNKEGIKQITNLAINVILPCSIITSFQMDIDKQLITNTLIVLICACLISLGYFFINLFAYKKLDRQEEVICKYGTMVTNASFIGLPIMNVLYGSVGVLYTSIFVLPQRILMWTYGLKLFSSKEKTDIKKALLHPCVISILIGVILMLFRTVGLTTPTLISDVLNYFSKGLTSLCMIVIGSSITDLKIEDLWKMKTLYYCFVRLILCPLLLIFIFRFIPIDCVVKIVCILMSGMPAPTTMAMLAKQYDYDMGFATSITLSSTLLSMITLPLIYSLSTMIIAI